MHLCTYMLTDEQRSLPYGKKIHVPKIHAAILFWLLKAIFLNKSPLHLNILQKKSVPCRHINPKSDCEFGLGAVILCCFVRNERRHGNSVA